MIESFWLTINCWISNCFKRSLYFYLNPSDQQLYAGSLIALNSLFSWEWVSAPLHLVARKCCICKKMLHLQEIFLQMQHFLAIFLHLQENFLQMQHFLATKVKKMLHWQDFLVNARFSWKCNIFLPLNVKVPSEELLIVESLIALNILFFSNWVHLTNY